jgi:Ca2+-binding EF-hand superfamily protein
LSLSAGAIIEIVSLVRPDEETMTPTKLRILTLASLLTFALSPAFAASPFAGIDTDNDGTVDLNEAKAAASPEFDKLDVDHDGALDHKELDGRLSKKDWVTADPDKDGTLTKDEYLNTVETIFKQADKDGDGAVDAKEARTPAGRALMRLLR